MVMVPAAAGAAKPVKAPATASETAAATRMDRDAGMAVSDEGRRLLVGRMMPSNRTRCKLRGTAGTLPKRQTSRGDGTVTAERNSRVGGSSRVVVITGASRGIGAACARLAAAAGWAVCVELQPGCGVRRAGHGRDRLGRRQGRRGAGRRRERKRGGRPVRNLRPGARARHRPDQQRRRRRARQPASTRWTPIADHAHAAHQRARLVPCSQGGGPPDVDAARRQRWRHRQHLVGCCPAGFGRRVRRLRGEQGRDRHDDARPGPRGRHRGHSGGRRSGPASSIPRSTRARATSAGCSASRR